MRASTPTALRLSRAPLVSLALVGILLLSLAARLYGIATESIWLDEATSLMLARMSVPALVQWTASDIHPPLYYILLHYWILLGQSEAALRGLSALAGVLNVWVIYGLGRTLFDRRTGLYAALLLALAPYHIWYAQEARMYAWVTTFASTSLLLALLAWRRGCWWVWGAYVLVTTAALYTHYYAVFGILIENLFFLYLWMRRRVHARLFWAWVASQVAVFVLFLPWFPIFLLPITVGGGGWVAIGLGRPSLSVLAQTAVLYMVGTGRALYPALLRRAGYLLFVGAFLFGLLPQGFGARLLRRRLAPQGDVAPQRYDENEAAAFCLVYLVLPLGLAWSASQVFKPMFSIRYMLPFMIPFILLVARGIRNLPWRALQAIALAALVVVMGFGIVAQVKLTDKPDWRTWSAQVIARSQPGDIVLFMPGWHARAFDYYAHGALPLYSDVPVPVDQYLEQMPTAVDKAIAGHPRVWLIWETNHYTDAKGAVYSYLSRRCRQVSEMRMPLVGRIILFENPNAAGGS
jgi:mannosyltransferase